MLAVFDTDCTAPEFASEDLEKAQTKFCMIERPETALSMWVTKSWFCCPFWSYCCKLTFRPLPKCAKKRSHTRMQGKIMFISYFILYDPAEKWWMKKDKWKSIVISACSHCCHRGLWSSSRAPGKPNIPCETAE